MNISESVVMAFQSVAANKLRASLTLLTISIGVFAIVGVATAVSALGQSIGTQLTSLGSTTFSIKRTPAIEFGNNWRKYRNRQEITLRQAQEFKRRMQDVEWVGLNRQSGIMALKSGGKTTDPNIQIIGGDETFALARDFGLANGRNIDASDVDGVNDVTVLGHETALRLFDNKSAIGKTVDIAGRPYSVVGVFNAKGATQGMSLDNIALVPITSAARYLFDDRNQSVDIVVRARSEEDVDEAVGEAVGIMRAIHRLKIGEPDDFAIETNESITEAFAPLTGFVAYFGIGCGVIALAAAGVGIMNIMLVSVKERTREIGIRKAIGATRSDIMAQFVVEAITLCQIGAVIGVLLGLIGGYGLGLAMNVSPPFPWVSVLGSVLACIAIGLVFGIFPAWKASLLDPIEALRYE